MAGPAGEHEREGEQERGQGPSGSGVAGGAAAAAADRLSPPPQSDEYWDADTDADAAPAPGGSVGAPGDTRAGVVDDSHGATDDTAGVSSDSPEAPGDAASVRGVSPHAPRQSAGVPGDSGESDDSPGVPGDLAGVPADIVVVAVADQDDDAGDPVDESELTATADASGAEARAAFAALQSELAGTATTGVPAVDEALARLAQVDPNDLAGSADVLADVLSRLESVMGEAPGPE